MRRGEVWLVALDPVRGQEMSKTRPCVIVSPDQLNEHLGTIVIAPMTSRRRSWRFRSDVHFEQPGQVTPDQIRSVSKARLRKRLGALDSDELARTLKTLRDMFA